jgi:DNA-binding transcriptional ArsR family regulator
MSDDLYGIADGLCLIGYIAGMAATWAALSDPHRRAAMALLLERPRAVGELVEELGLTQPGTSKHLRVLRDAGLVRVRVDAQRRVYEVDPAPLAELDLWLAPYRALWADSLDRLAHHLELTSGEAGARDGAPHGTGRRSDQDEED